MHTLFKPGTIGEVCTPREALRSAWTHDQQRKVAVKDRLRISAPSSFGRHCILPLVSVFLASHTELEIDLQLADACCDSSSSPFDIIIRDGHRPTGHWVAREIAPMRMLVCAAPSYLALHGVPRTLFDLAHHNCIALRSPHSDRGIDWEFEDANRVWLVPVNGNLIVDSVDAAAWSAQHGLGLTQLGSYVCIDAIWEQQFAVVLREFTSTKRNHWLCSAEPALLPAHVRAFADFVLEQVPQRWWFGQER
jgi:DNA-binding transcriptional LysR family regulator